mgnify:CR=1 FL=1
MRNNFRCKDGKWICGVHHPEEKYWPLLCKGTGLERLLDDQRFQDYDSRLANGKALIAIFDEVFHHRVGPVHVWHQPESERLSAQIQTMFIL